MSRASGRTKQDLSRNTGGNTGGRKVYRNRINYSEYISNCIPMSSSNPAQSSTPLECRERDGELNQSDSNFDEPAVTAMAPIRAWVIAIVWAEGWRPCEWPNSISPPMMANVGNGVAQTA